MLGLFTDISGYRVLRRQICHHVNIFVTFNTIMNILDGQHAPTQIVPIQIVAVLFFPNQSAFAPYAAVRTLPSLELYVYEEEWQ